MMRSCISLCIAFLLATSAACSDATAPPPPPPTGLIVVATPAAVDTARATPPQAIVVELRDSAGAPIPDVIVAFTSVTFPCGTLSGCQFPSMFVMGATDNQFLFGKSITTNASGRAVALVEFGPRAGAAGVIVKVPELGLLDTIPFTILPGALASVSVFPPDTALGTGGAIFVPTVRATDANGNLRQDPITVTSSSPSLEVTTANAFRTRDTPGLFRGIVASGAFSDTVMVGIVPDGMLVATRVAAGVSSLVVVNTDGRGMQEVADRVSSYYAAPEWSADGTRVIYRGGASPENQLASVGLTGGDLLALPTTGVRDSGWPFASADGEWIYFSGMETHLHLLWRMRNDGTQLERISDSAAPIDEARPSISADGTLLAYETNTTITVRDLSTGTVTTTALPGIYARFSPVENRIAYITSNRRQIAITDPDGSNHRVLSTIFGNFDGLDWSPDGKWIVTSRDGQLLLIEVATGAEIPLRWTGEFNQPAWRP